MTSAHLDQLSLVLMSPTWSLIKAVIVGLFPAAALFFVYTLTRCHVQISRQKHKTNKHVYTPRVAVTLHVQVFYMDRWGADRTFLIRHVRRWRHRNTARYISNETCSVFVITCWTSHLFRYQPHSLWTWRHVRILCRWSADVTNCFRVSAEERELWLAVWRDNDTACKCTSQSEAPPGGLDEHLRHLRGPYIFKQTDVSEKVFYWNQLETSTVQSENITSSRRGHLFEAAVVWSLQFPEGSAQVIQQFIV